MIILFYFFVLFSSLAVYWGAKTLSETNNLDPFLTAWIAGITWYFILMTIFQGLFK